MFKIKSEWKSKFERDACCGDKPSECEATSSCRAAGHPMPWQIPRLTWPAGGEQEKPLANPESKQGGKSQDSEPKMSTLRKQENVKLMFFCCSTLPVIVLQHPWAKEKQKFWSTNVSFNPELLLFTFPQSLKALKKLKYKPERSILPPEVAQ